jgi:Flp pilus assembly protein TadD
VGISLIAFAGARSWPGLAAGWVAYLAILAPNSGLVTFGHQLVADRYSYLAMMPWSIVSACRLAGALTRNGRLIIVPSSVVLLLLGILTREQCRTWRDSVRLWRNVLAWDDSSSSAHNNLASLLVGEGRYREALRHYELAAKYAPTSAGPPLNRGVLLAQLGEPAEAQAYLEEALRRDPSASETRAWLAMVLSDQGRTAEALAHCGRALRETPHSARVLMARGTILARAGRLAEAEADLERARHLDPLLRPPPLSLALALGALGQLAQAEQVFRDLLAGNPESAEAHAGLGEVLARRGDRRGAAEHYRQALRIRPDHPAAARWQRQAAGGGRSGL